MKYIRILTASASLSALVCSASVAWASENLTPEALLKMSLEELGNLEVTSVSKTAEKANEAAAAVFVLTQEDIARSGATSIPEALRMVPGVSVARAGAHDWAVSVRGFNGQFANKLLVLIDGRTVYNPMFSGTFWEVQDTLLEDIDRIEVIRGPGAAQWGANAVNGIINIITKDTKNTQGGFMTASAGNMVQANGGGRYGGKIGEESYARMYVKYNKEDAQFNIDTGRSGDEWQKRQAGFRSDATLTDRDSLTLQGDIYDTNEGLTLNFPSLSAPYLIPTPETMESSGANILARWTRNLSPQSTTTVQAYYDNAQHKNGYVAYNTNTFDVDFQHIWTGWKGHEVVWGAGYRLIQDHEGVTQVFQLLPMDRDDSVYSAFLQDKITLRPDDLFLTIGSKFEYNDYTNVEIQPSARLSWLIDDSQMAWGGVSRAVHPSNRFTSDTQMNIAVAPPNTFVAGIPALLQVVGNPGLDSEELIAYELGYRVQPTDSLSVDVAAFYNDYSNLFTGTYGTGMVAGGGTYYYQPLFAANTNSASSKGLEVSTRIDATKNWQIAASYSYIDLVFKQKADPAFSFTNNPKHQFNVRSTYLFPYGVEMTNSLYYVSKLPTASIQEYYRFDTKISYEIADGVELNLVGQNLFQPYHQEFSAFLFQSPVEIGRSVYGNITWKF